LEIKLTPEFVSKLLEGPKVWLAGGEGAALGDGIVEVHGNEIGDFDEGRVPPIAFNTTVQPIKGSIGTGSLGDLLCEGSNVERNFVGGGEKDSRVAPLGPHLSS